MNKKIITVLILFSIGDGALAQESQEQLDTIDVTDSIDQGADAKIGETVKTSEQLSNQQVQNTRDLVKYETGITVVEKGRMGSSGYAIRGVQENRVNITMDGLQQAQTMSSQGVQELFEGYGNFNNTRNGVEIENIQEVRIAKGADSTGVGSGALGGTVIFKTKDARDYLLDKDYFVGTKSGYSSSNDEFMLSQTMAFRAKKFDILFVNTNRKGNEIENFNYDDYDDNEQGRARKKADPYDIDKKSTLLKLSYNLNENNRFTIALDNGEKISKGRDWSYTLAPLVTDPNKPEVDLRHTNDRSTRKNLAFSFENYDSNMLWDDLKFSVSKQNINQVAQTDEYCEGENCASYKNEGGVSFKDGNFVDKYGEKITVQRNNTSGMTELVDSKGDTYDAYNVKDADEFWVDCSKYDCSKGMDVFTIGWSNGDQANWEHVDLDRQFKDDKGKVFASTSKSGVSVYIPSSTGFSEGFYRKRDLKTDTLNLSLDLSKSFSTKDINHTLEYGFAYDKTKKSMVNTEYFRAIPGEQVMWWAEQFAGLDWKGDKIKCYDGWGSPTSKLICPTLNPPTFSFLIPVETTGKSFYISDSVRVSDWLNVDLAYRYDKISYEPQYTEGVTAKIPDSMIQGLFIPAPHLPPEPKWWDFSGPDKLEKFKKAHKEWKKTKTLVDQNPAKNREYLAKQKPVFDNHSYSIGVTADPLDYLRIQGKFSKGFRAPTTDEMFFTFKHPDFTIYPNLDLIPETAKTKELAFTLHRDKSYLTLSAFVTDYKDFIDLSYTGKKRFKDASGNLAGMEYMTYKNINQQDAHVYGFEISGKAYLGELKPNLSGFNVGYKYTRQKGKVYRQQEQAHTPMNAIQPNKHVLSLGYISENKDYGLDVHITHTETKKAEDTYNPYHKFDGSQNDFAKYTSDAYTKLDILGFYKPTKNLTLRAGVFNILNAEYTTWDNARSIKHIGTSNRVCQTGNIKSIGCDYASQGLERFSSPERNFQVGLEYKF